MYEIVNKYANNAVVSTHQTAKQAAKEYYKILKKFRKNRAISPGSIFPLEIRKECKNLFFWEDQGQIGITEIRGEEDYQILCVIPS